MRGSKASKASNECDCPVDGHDPLVHRGQGRPGSLTVSCSCGWKPIGENPDDELVKHLAAAFMLGVNERG